MPRLKSNEKTIDPENLTKKDVDFLNLPTEEAMKKYSVGKQTVYDRRYALKKRLQASGLSVEDVVAKKPVKEAKASKEVAAPKTTESKKPGKRRGRPKKVKGTEKPDATMAETTTATPTESKELMIVPKQMPVVMKPVEINFDNFSIKLNGVPRRLSINPDTNAIEIDL